MQPYVCLHSELLPPLSLMLWHLKHPRMSWRIFAHSAKRSPTGVSGKWTPEDDLQKRYSMIVVNKIQITDSVDIPSSLTQSPRVKLQGAFRFDLWYIHTLSCHGCHDEVGCVRHQTTSRNLWCHSCMSPNIRVNFFLTYIMYVNHMSDIIVRRRSYVYLSECGFWLAALNENAENRGEDWERGEPWRTWRTYPI